MSDTPPEPKRRAAHPPPASDAPEPEVAPAADMPAPSDAALQPEAESEHPARRGQALPWLLAAGLVAVAALAATPFWAPTVTRLLPWGEAAKPAVPAPPAPAAAEADPAIAAMRAQTAQNAAAVQQLGQRIAALEVKPAPPPPDLSAIRQQLGTLATTTTELDARIAALQKAVQERPAADLNPAALALTLLQVREAVELARPFGPEYQTLLALARDHPEIAAAAQPLATAAANGVASRAALTERLRQLAPRIATAEAPPDSGWTARIEARLRGLVTIRRVDGGSQTPAEAAASSAERAMAGGDLAGAVDALSGLTGPPAIAAEPWLRMARERLTVEAALRQVAAAVTATLGKPMLNPAAPGKG